MEHTRVVGESSIPARKIIPLLLRGGMLSENANVSYIVKEVCLGKGIVTEKGIVCNCCDKAFAVTSFGKHVNKTNKKASEYTFLVDPVTGIPGDSFATLRRKLKSKDQAHSEEQKSVEPGHDEIICCEVCNVGGELLCCKTLDCNAALHYECAGNPGIAEKQGVTDGEWYCQRCICDECLKALWKQSPDDDNSKKPTLSYCELCGRNYHMTCILKAKKLVLSEMMHWFCSEECKGTFDVLSGHVKRDTVQSESDWTLLRPSSTDEPDLEWSRSMEQKLYRAWDLLADRFEFADYIRDQPYLLWDTVHNYRSEVCVLSYIGFYTILLEDLENGLDVAAATFRIHGQQQVAEMPFIATALSYCKQGECKLIINMIEAILKVHDVKLLVIQSPPEATPMWTGKFGFQLMDSELKVEFQTTTLLRIGGTSLLFKGLE